MEVGENDDLDEQAVGETVDVQEAAEKMGIYEGADEEHPMPLNIAEEIEKNTES